MNAMNAEARHQRNLRVRIAVLCALMAILPARVMFEAFDLQVVRSEQLKAKAEKQAVGSLARTPQRGAIYDREGAELAVSVDADSIWANPRQLRKDKEDVKTVARSLAKLLELDQAAIEGRLSLDRAFVWVKRRATAAESKAVQALKIAGVSVSKEARRYYPNRELGAHLLGHANVDDRGIAGVELMMDEKLRGSRFSAPVVRDGSGHVVYSEHLVDDLTNQGHDVTLTIDKTLQYYAERELALAVQTSEARAGSVVVVDPTSGAILALASYPTFNLNDAGHATDEQRRNRAITERFEPGSTVKPFTMAGALSAGVVKATDSIDCTAGSLVVDGKPIRDVHHFGNLTPSEIIARSSNVGISKIGSAMGRERLYHVLKNFGFGTAPGSGLPGEVAGLLRPHQRWYAHDAATIPFGQAMSTTPLQLAMSMSALANKGRLLEPLLIRRVVDARGQTVEEGLPRLRKQVVPEHVARLVTEMMEGVVREGGTAQEAAIDGYRVAGKTGTAQKSDPTQGGYSDKKYIASFVGFAPANNPKLTIAVVLDEPMIQHQGGQVAAPVFRRVMADSLRHLGVPAERSQATAAALPHAQPQPSKTASNTQADAPQRRASEVPAGRVHVGPSQTLVPNLIGRPARQAVVQARQAMLEVSLQGSGVVSSQQPLAGVVVQRGSSIALQLISPTPDLPAPPLASDLAQVGPAQEPGKAADTVEPAPVRRGQDG